jgi:hypothetical protein
MRGMCVVVLALVAAGCGSDSSGPSTVSYSGSYPGEFYVISSSTSPAGRDSANGGPVTLSLASTGGEDYTFSSTTSSGGSSAPVSINSAGAMSFPNFDEASALNLIGSFVSGLCSMNGANATPSGSVLNRRLAVSFIVSGATCDWSGGGGTDIRATIIQLTWTGTKS